MGIAKLNNAIVFGLTSNYSFAVASVLMDLKKHCEENIAEIIIYHDGICAKDHKLLAMEFGAKLFRYDFPEKYNGNFNNATISRFSKMVFSKYECFSLLNNYTNVLWLDYDMVIKQNISELLLDDCPTGIKMMPGGAPVSAQFFRPILEYDMQREGISSCVFSLNQKLLIHDAFHKFCYEFTQRNAPNLYLPEQGAIDCGLQHFNLNICPISRQKYSAHPTEIELIPDASIIHAFGQPKFWDGIENEQWQSNYAYWKSIGGSPYKKTPFIFRAVAKIRRSLKTWGLFV